MRTDLEVQQQFPGIQIIVIGLQALNQSWVVLLFID